MKLSFRGRAARSAPALPAFLGTLLLVLLSVAPVLAAGPYLSAGHPDALALLPPPPETNSTEQAADLAEVLAVFKTRTPADETAALAEQEPTIFCFTPAIGTNFHAGKFPKTEALLEEVQKETSAVAKIPKNFYHRSRPFLLDSRLAFGPPESGFSYPSGHSTFGTVEAALLAELFPQHAQAILEEGLNLGWHRVQTGKHYPTDIYAGRVLGRAIVRELKANPAFQHDFAECAAELAAAIPSP